MTAVMSVPNASAAMPKTAGFASGNQTWVVKKLAVLACSDGDRAPDQEDRDGGHRHEDQHARAAGQASEHPVAAADRGALDPGARGGRRSARRLEGRAHLLTT